MVLYQAKDYKDMSRKAANIISAQVIMKPNAVLGLATGSTPVGAYEQLVEWYNKGDIDFSQVTSVNLDEYKGLSGDNDQSYRYFMNKNLFDHVNIDKARTFVPDGTEPDSKVACAKYNAIIDSVGGIDLQLLGIGGNGHIGFNEPGSAFESLTHCVALKEDTIKANARFFETMDDVNRFLNVTEHFPFAVDLKRGHRTVNGKSILGVASIGLGREMDFCAYVPEIAPEIMSSLDFCMR